MARGTSLRTHDLKKIAVAAGVDERSVAKAILGIPGMLPLTLQRIERALRDLGYPRPRAADREPSGTGGGEAA